MGESPGDKLVEEADHPAQLPLAALLAVAHGSGSQRRGETQPHPLPAAKQPPSSSEQRAMPAGGLNLAARSEPAGMGARRSPAERAGQRQRQRPAARQPPAPLPGGGQRQVLRGDAPVRVGSGTEGPAAVPLPSRGSGSRKPTAERERDVRVPRPGPCPHAGPLRAAKLRGAAGSGVRGVRGAGEPSGPSGRGGWTPPWLAEPRVAPGS